MSWAWGKGWVVRDGKGRGLWDQQTPSKPAEWEQQQQQPKPQRHKQHESLQTGQKVRSHFLALAQPRPPTSENKCCFFLVFVLLYNNTAQHTTQNSLLHRPPQPRLRLLRQPVHPHQHHHCRTKQNSQQRHGTDDETTTKTKHRNDKRGATKRKTRIRQLGQEWHCDRRPRGVSRDKHGRVQAPSGTSGAFLDTRPRMFTLISCLLLIFRRPVRARTTRLPLPRNDKALSLGIGHMLAMIHVDRALALRTRSRASDSRCSFAPTTLCMHFPMCLAVKPSGPHQRRTRVDTSLAAESTAPGKGGDKPARKDKPRGVGRTTITTYPAVTK